MLPAKDAELLNIDPLKETELLKDVRSYDKESSKIDFSKETNASKTLRLKETDFMPGGLVCSLSFSKVVSSNET